MEKGFTAISLWIKEIFSDSLTVITGLFSSVVGYFLPMKDVLTVLAVFFVIDMLAGYWKNKKLYKERFSKRKVFETTVPRMIAVMTFIMMLFVWDVSFKQEYVSTYMVVGWFICGVLLFNIAKNFYLITRWKPFKDLGGFVQKQVEDRTGMEISDLNK